MLLTILILFNLVINKENFYSFNIIEPNGFNSFDKFMYINLEHRKDRKNQIENEINKMNIDKNKIIRIDAVRNKYNGHIGCCKSHIKAVKLAKQMNLNNVVIFEDDFVFTLPKKEINNKINHFIEKYKDWDIIQFTTAYKNLKDINDKNIKKVNSATTSSGYIIQKHFYNKLINDLETALNKMEKEMVEFKKKNPNKKKKETGYALDQHWDNLQKTSKWYIFDPYLGKQGGAAKSSSIMGSIESFLNRVRIHKIKV